MIHTPARIFLTRVFALLQIACALATAGLPAAAFAAAGTRTIFVMRHGQYDEHDPRDDAIGRGLTLLGRDQARLAGARFGKLPVKVTEVFASPLTRARETGELAAAEMGMKPVLLDDLRECTPATIRADIMARNTPGALDSCRRQLDRVFDRFFRPTAGPDSSVLLVAHGNVTRYLVARSIQLDSLLWLNTNVPHGSIATIRVRPDGKMQLYGLGDIGHLAPEMVTFTNPPKDTTGTKR